MEALIAGARPAGRAETEARHGRPGFGPRRGKAAFNAHRSTRPPPPRSPTGTREQADGRCGRPPNCAEPGGVSNKPIFIRGAGENNTLPPRETTVGDIRGPPLTRSRQIDRVIAAWNAYEAQANPRRPVVDIVRQLRGGRSLNFRITINPGTFAQEAEARRSARRHLSRSRVDKAKWYKINKSELGPELRLRSTTRRKALGVLRQPRLRRREYRAEGFRMLLG